MLPPELDPAPLELVALSERAEWLSGCCEDYQQQLQGQAVELIFKDESAWDVFRKLLDARSYLGQWSDGGESIRFATREVVSSEYSGWSGDELWSDLASDIGWAYETLNSSLGKLAPDANDIRWVNAGFRNQIRQWFVMDYLEIEAARVEEEFASGTRFRQEWILSCAVDAWDGLESDQDKYWERFRQLRSGSVDDVVAFVRHRRRKADAGKLNYQVWDDRPRNVVVKADWRFPELKRVFREEGGELANRLSADAGWIMDQLQSSELSKRRTGDGRTLRFDLAKWPTYRGYSEPLRSIEPYCEGVHDVDDIFEAALSIEVAEGVRLRNGGDVAWLVCERCKYNELLLAGQVEVSLRSYLLQRFPKQLESVEGFERLSETSLRNAKRAAAKQAFESIPDYEHTEAEVAENKQLDQEAEQAFERMNSIRAELRRVLTDGSTLREEAYFELFKLTGVPYDKLKKLPSAELDRLLEAAVNRERRKLESGAQWETKDQIAKRFLTHKGTIPDAGNLARVLKKMPASATKQSGDKSNSPRLYKVDVAVELIAKEREHWRLTEQV